MAYIPKLSPTVGNGLGGMPEKKTLASTGSCSFTTSNGSVVNAFKAYDLLYKNKDTGSLYAFDWYTAPRGPNAVNLTANYSDIQQNNVQSFFGVRSQGLGYYPEFIDQSNLYIESVKLTKNSDTSFSIASALSPQFGGTILVLNNTHYIEYKLTQTTVNSKMVLTLQIQKRKLSDNSNITGVLSKDVTYTATNIEASINSYTQYFRLTQTSTGNLIGIFYINTYTTGNIYKNGFFHCSIKSNFTALADISIELRLSSYNSSYAPDMSYGSMYKGHSILLGSDDYYGAILFECSDAPNYYPIPYFYIYKDGTLTYQRTGTQITSGYYQYTHSFSGKSGNGYVPSTSFIDVGYTGGVPNGTFTLKTIGGGRPNISNPMAIIYGTVSSNTSTTSVNSVSSVYTPPINYGSEQLSSLSLTIDKYTASVFINFRWQDNNIPKYGATLFSYDLYKNVGQVLYVTDYGSNSTSYSSYEPDITVKDFYSDKLFAFRKDHTNASYTLMNSYRRYENGSYVLHGISKTQGTSGSTSDVIENGVLNTSPFGAINIDFRSSGGKLLFGANQNSYIGV